MKINFLNKISKTALVFLAISLVGAFCFQIVSANQGGAVMAREFSHSKGTSSNMMPCCEESSGHLLGSFDLPSTKYPLQVLSLLLMIIPMSLILFASDFSKYSYSYSSLAPPGPDLLLTIVKRE